MTKRNLGILNAHSCSNLYRLSDCYNNCSYFKQRAYDYEFEKMVSLDGWNFKIISYNCQMFTIGFYYNKDNKTYFHYASNRIDLDFEVE